MADLIEQLTTAWIDWENAPTWRQTVITKEEALKALELNSNQAHNHIAQWRRAGYSIPDAVQSLINEPLEEAA